MGVIEDMRACESRDRSKVLLDWLAEATEWDRFEVVEKLFGREAAMRAFRVTSLDRGLLSNLAGIINADAMIRFELEQVCIEVVEGGADGRGEVPATITGRLPGFTFRRAWVYWVVDGDVPIAAARKMYNEPLGRMDVRVAGFAGNVEPVDPWIRWKLPDGQRVYPTAWKSDYADEKAIFSDDPESIGATCFVDSYHIDSQAGLSYFVKTVKEHCRIGLDG